MSPEKFRKLAYSELEISTVNIISLMTWGNEQTDRQTRNMKLFEVLYKNPRNVSRKFEKKLTHLEVDIIISVRKLGNVHTYINLKLL